MKKWDSEGPFEPLHVMNPQDLLSFEFDSLPFLPKTHSLLFVLVGYRISNMASKFVRQSHHRALSSSISINNHIRSPHFSNPNPN